MKFLTAVAVALLLTGCATTTAQVSKAEALCAPNGGLMKVYPKMTNNITMIVCNNGAFFKLKEDTPNELN